jgi:SPP1 gp7 family putative phage head morphogenesis protein
MKRMAKLSYWERRQAENMILYMEEAEQAAKEIAKLYQRASVYLSSQIDGIFEKYRNRYGLSDQEALLLLKEIKEEDSLRILLRALEESKNNQEREELRKVLEGAAYKARIDRLQSIMNQLDTVMQTVYKQEKQISESHYVKLAEEAYYREIYNVQQQMSAEQHQEPPSEPINIESSFAHVDSKLISDVVNSRWSGANYSERIWKNTKALAQALKEELLLNFVTGRTEQEAAIAIARRFGVGTQIARRLVRTESNYIATEMRLKSDMKCGIEEYKFLAVLDLKTSKVCRKLDGKKFPIKDHVIGKNCPPMHPWCRSTTVPVIGEDDGQRSATDPSNGKAILVPEAMTYEEWYDQYVKGKPEAELAEKQIKNRTADKEQHKKYREILGDEVPEKLDDFQKMKYTEEEKWKYTKLGFQRRNDLLKHPELKLPNAEKAIAEDAKFEKYLFDGMHPEGLAKGKAIESRLGYDIKNWQEFRKEILDGATKYPAVYQRNNGFCDMYEQKMILFGTKGSPANVIVGWSVSKDGTMMASAYIKEVK